jgi:hypothetical protein
MADTQVEPAPEVAPESTPEVVNLAEIRARLQLGEESTEQDIISALLNVIAAQQAQYEALVSEKVDTEEQITNRIMDAYPEVIGENRSYWSTLLTYDQDNTIALLNRLAGAAAPAVAPAAKEPAPTAPAAPLKNRLADKPRTAEAITNGSSQAEANAKAIANRAHEIRRTSGRSFAEAWTMAEREITKE